MLTVDRSQNCYGPGDRVVVHATIRSDSTHATILRGFEFTLKETTIFRAGPHVGGRSGGPQIKINIIGEQKGAPLGARSDGPSNSHHNDTQLCAPY